MGLKSRSVYAIIIVLAIFSIFLYFNYSQSKTLLAPKKIAASPYCTNPLLVSNSTGSFSFGISGRTISYLPNDNSVNFYDMGSDMKFGTSDDIGIINITSLQYNSSQYVVSFLIMKGTTAVFGLVDLTSGQPSLNIYSIGNDSIAGSSDDFGPVSMFVPNPLTNVLNVNLDNDLVSFRTTDNFLPYLDREYYCNTNIPSGTCWTSSPTLFGSNLTIWGGDYISTNNGSNLYHFWTSLGDIYYNLSLSNYSYQGKWYRTSPFLQEKLHSISFPFILSSEFDLNNFTFANRTIKIGSISNPSNPISLSPLSLGGVSTFEDDDPVMSKNINVRNNYLLAWNRFIRPGNYSYFVVSKFPYDGTQVVIPGTQSAVGAIYGAPAVDGNNVAFAKSNSLFISECYL